MQEQSQPQQFPQRPFKRLLFEQGSLEWLAWRRLGIGASDAPAIMDQSPYGHPWTLWEEKLGLRPDKIIPQDVLDKAHRMEDAARAWYELKNDKDCPPACMEMVQYPFLKASLDGYNEKENFILEIKYVGHKAIKENMVMHHWIQNQHQMMVTGATDVLLIRTNDGVYFDAKIIERDEKFIQELLAREIAFQQMVISRIRPVEPHSRRKKTIKNE